MFRNAGKSLSADALWRIPALTIFNQQQRGGDAPRVHPKFVGCHPGLPEREDFMAQSVRAEPVEA